VNATQKIMQKVMLGFREYKRQSAIVKRRARADYQHALSELELIIDDIKAEGIDPESELGRAMILEVIKARIPSEAPVSFCDKDGFPNRGGEL